MKSKQVLYLVGMRGFEPPTPSSRTKCATGLRYIPNVAGIIEEFSEGCTDFVHNPK